MFQSYTLDGQFCSLRAGATFAKTHLFNLLKNDSKEGLSSPLWINCDSQIFSRMLLLFGLSLYSSSAGIVMFSIGQHTIEALHRKTEIEKWEKFWEGRKMRILLRV